MRKIFIVAAAACSLAGCAQAARVDQMAAAPTTALSTTSGLRQAVQVANISGGTSTNPLWMSKVGNAEFQAALTSSLGAAGLLASNGGRYSLDATLVALRQPMIGFDLTVHSQVHYKLVDTVGGKAVFDSDIDADFTAGVGDAFIAVERLRLANEGSIKKNIQTFMDQLIAGYGNGPAISAITLSDKIGG